MSRYTLGAALTLVVLTGSGTWAVGSSVDVATWEWTLVEEAAPWQPRAGLEVVELAGRFYLMGGRTPRPPMFPPIPGDSDIWGDVWTSDDGGRTWRKILDTATPGHWPARAYFKAVTRGEEIFVLGGQNFLVVDNPDCPPPHTGCAPFISASDFFNDVWRSSDGVSWVEATDDAGWSGRAGLSAVVFEDELYVIGGSFLDDPSIVGGPPVRIYFNDVWKSSDGTTWEQVTEKAPWAARAGAAVVVKDGAIYLLGGEEGFICTPQPCDPPYFNDVWRSSNGADWELVTDAAEWTPRPGHRALVVEDTIVLFGGFGQSTDPTDPFAPANPMDVWVSQDGASWTQVSDMPWNADGPEDIKYDFAAVAVQADHDDGLGPAIYTFGGDRETFDFTDPQQYLNVDNDVWRFSMPVEPCAADVDRDGAIGFTDLLTVLAQWGPCSGCAADLDGDDAVGAADLFAIISNWGPCR